MREILFRGKNPITNEFVIGDLFQHGEQCFIMVLNRNIEVPPETVGQYTGLCDKNGVKIFEGDIVEYEHHGIKERAVIRYGVPKDKERHTMYGWYLDDNHGNTAFLFGKVFIETYNYAVIGNIYNDPKLIKTAS